MSIASTISKHLDAVSSFTLEVVQEMLPRVWFEQDGTAGGIRREGELVTVKLSLGWGEEDSNLIGTKSSSAEGLWRVWFWEEITYPK